MRTAIRDLPPLNTGHLWKVQIESIQNLETSLAANRPRALIPMATGSGKTFTAVIACYRLIKFAKARRILFLVDRNNLGKQTLNEFQQFVSPYNGYKFTEEYTVQHLKTNTIDPAEQDRMRQSLKPFHNPKLRNAILHFKQSHEQVIDEQTPDTLLRAGFDAASKEKAQSLLTNFRQFIDDHRDEIEALQILYSQPYRAGLRHSSVKELAKALRQPPHSLHPERLWQAYETVEPDKVQGHGGKQLVDVVALVRHALDPNTPLAPIGLTVEERYQQWLVDQAAAGTTFTPEQRRWLDAIKDHIATSLAIDREDLDEVPFNQIGGLGRAYELFGDRLSELLDELNAKLAA